ELNTTTPNPSPILPQVRNPAAPHSSPLDRTIFNSFGVEFISFLAPETGLECAGMEPVLFSCAAAPSLCIASAKTRSNRATHPRATWPCVGAATWKPHKTVKFSRRLHSRPLRNCARRKSISLWRADAKQNERDFSTGPGEVRRRRDRPRETVSPAELLAERGRFLGRARDTGIVGSVWHPPAYRPRESCRVLRHEHLAPSHFRWVAAEGFAHGSPAVAALPAACGGQRPADRHPALGPHDDAAALARVAQ